MHCVIFFYRILGINMLKKRFKLNLVTIRVHSTTINNIRAIIAAEYSNNKNLLGLK